MDLRGGFHSYIYTSNVRDDARNDMHTHAMSLLKKQGAEASGLVLASYAPIAKAFDKLSETMCVAES